MKHSVRDILALSLTAILTLGACSSNTLMQSLNSADNVYFDVNGAYADYAEAEVPEAMAFERDYDFSYETESSAATDSPAKMKGESFDADGAEKKNAANGRKIISSCTYRIQTNTYDSAIAALDALMEKYGAYCEYSEQDGTAESADRCYECRIRVPREYYEAFRAGTGSVGVINFASENNEDVSERYFDTEAHLSSAKVREERLLEILEKADSLDNVLLLEQALEDVRYEIESYSGTLRKYDSLISYSTVNMTIREVIKPVAVQVAPKTFGEKLAQSASEGLSDFADGVEGFTVWFVYALPGLLLFALIVVAIVFIIRGAAKRAKKKKAAETAAKAEPAPKKDAEPEQK